jgi:hypothetical protein
MRDLKKLPAGAQLQPVPVDLTEPLDQLTLTDSTAALERIHATPTSTGEPAAAVGLGAHATLRRAGRRP